MAKGFRLTPLQLTKLYNRFIDVIKEKTKEPKLVIQRKRPKRKEYYYNEEQKWLLQFNKYIDDKATFKSLVNCISDSQWSYIFKAVSRFEKQIRIPCLGFLEIHSATYQVLKENDFDVSKVLNNDTIDMKARHKAFYDKLREDKFLKYTNREKYEESRTERLAALLQRRTT